VSTEDSSIAGKAGKIITFYSYKGGTGRSMALANVAWILAHNGQKVLAIDWDLEAPGLHRYFEPFLADATLENSTGVIDFVLEFATAAVSGNAAEASSDWFVPYSNLLVHATAVQGDFQGGGSLDFVPAGRQDAAYAARVNSFNWHQFYERVGGGVFLEQVKLRMRSRYDYILIDSRTGVSDTSGVCTVQMPDEVVVCLTLNRQSIFGAATSAVSIFNQRKRPDGSPSVKIWPVPMRIEFAEKERLETAQTLMRARFAGLMPHLTPDDEERYWGTIEVPYHPFYAYEEALAVFGDRPHQSSSILAKMEVLAGYLSEQRIQFFKPMGEEVRQQGLAKFTTRSAWASLPHLQLLASEYERIRQVMKAGDSRTYLMSALVSRAQQLAGRLQSGTLADQLFRQNTDGTRILGLALARNEPQRSHVEMALEGIANRRSAFEQYYALNLVPHLLPHVDPTAREQLKAAIESQNNKTITRDDLSRWTLAQEILKNIAATAQPLWASAGDVLNIGIGNAVYQLSESKPTSPFVLYKDIDEHHGPFVVTRQEHQVQLPRIFRIGRHLVTNELYAQFIMAKGYENDEFWPEMPGSRLRCVTRDSRSLGPKNWPNAHAYPDGEAGHPVSGISFFEAQAFVRWCNTISPPDTGWQWSLPSEDLWEFAARTETGLVYPWGDAFDAGKCNSSESGLGRTSAVTRFPDGASRLGCCDMAGNVWEFVLATDAERDWCVLRGGSYNNTRFEVRSYLRLIRVPKTHRPPDFGFRLAQVSTSSSIA
jgi:formylglycine-generating enzyme required for sulfatase activity/cellulose biosynthesis protein BcsQ